MLTLRVRFMAVAPLVRAALVAGGTGDLKQAAHALNTSVGSRRCLA